MEIESQLWDMNILGSENPNQLNRTLVYLMGIHLGLRGGQELRNLSVGNNGQISVQTDNSGGEFLLFQENYSKTFRGGLKDSRIEPRELKVYPNDTNEEKCPVRLFKKYLNLRPSEGKCDALFLTPLAKPKQNQWFADAPIGKNTLCSTIKNIMEMAAIDNGTYTNHSCRKTTVTRIMQATNNFSIAKLATGHRSEAIEQYDQSGHNNDRLISEIIQGHNLLTPSPTTTSSNHSLQSTSSSTTTNESNTNTIVVPNEKPLFLTIKKGDTIIELKF